MRVGIKCAVDGALVSDEECLRCRMNDCDRVDTDCGYAYEVLKGIMDSSGRSTAHTSATMLTNSCHRRVWLEQREDYYVDPKVMYPAYRGTMGHIMTEMYPQPGCFYEQRFETIITIDKKKIRITGALDKLNIDEHYIHDFKTKADAKLSRLKVAEESHTMQLNIYRWLVFNGWPQKRMIHKGLTYRKNVPSKIRVDSLKLFYQSMNGVKMFVPPIMDLQDVEEYVYDQARDLI